MRFAGALAAGLCAVAGAAVAAPQLDKVKLPAGFTIETWAGSDRISGTVGLYRWVVAGTSHDPMAGYLQRAVTVPQPAGST